MKNILSTLIITCLLVGCGSKVIMTGRRQVKLLPESMMQNMAASQYASFLSTNKFVQGTTDAEMVNRVSKRIIGAVNDYYGKRNRMKDLAGYNWEYKLINQNVANAWAMPGGKIVVYSGLLPITQNEAGLAAVIGHEVSHALANHGNERMTQGLLAQGIQIAGAVALSKKPEVQNLFLQSFGIGSQLGLLAFSRQQESEADRIGLIFMSIAGYNPNEAVNVWRRMASTGKQQPPEFLSTHPSNETRIAQLTKLLPEALKFYTPQN
jgi:predicted Zn-dependent protease